MIEEKIEGKRSHGRISMRWIHQIKTITGYSLENAIKATCIKHWKEMLPILIKGSPKFHFWNMDLRRLLNT